MKKRATAIIIGLVLAAALINGCQAKEKLTPPTPTEVPLTVTSTPTKTPTSIPTLTPAQTAKASLDLLKKRLEEEMSPYGENVAIAVTDLQTGESASVNGDEVFYPASAAKILTLVSVLRDVDAGLYPLSDVEDDIISMMSYSDNYANDVLVEKTGFDRIGEVIALAGMVNTQVCHGYDFLAYACHTPNEMTANDANALWEALLSGKILSGENTLRAISYGALPDVQYIFAPEEFLLAHKPGYIDGYIIDSGVVLDGMGRGYAVSFFSEDLGDPEGVAEELTQTIFSSFFGE